MDSSFIIDPPLASKLPARIDKIVDFPHPDGPTIDTNSFFFKSYEKSETASVSDFFV